MGIKFQAFHDVAFDQMFIDDFIDIIFIDIGVPRFFRVNDDHRAFVTTIQATGIVDADFSLAAQLQRFNALFGIIAQFLRAEIVAAFGIALALIGAEKNMVLIITHECSQKIEIGVSLTQFYFRPHAAEHPALFVIQIRDHLQPR